MKRNVLDTEMYSTLLNGDIYEEHSLGEKKCVEIMADNITPHTINVVSRVLAEMLRTTTSCSTRSSQETGVAKN